MHYYNEERDLGGVWMLKENVIKMLEEKQTAQDSIELYKDEIAYINEKELISEISVTETDSYTRFFDAYIERVNKETEEMIAEETPSNFLDKPLSFLKENIEEFAYTESPLFEMIGVEGVTLELDDVFRYYNVLLGLKVQKKWHDVIKTYLSEKISGGKFELSFNGNDGLWDVNFALDGVQGFHEGMSIGEAYKLIYTFLFNLVSETEK